MTPEPVRAIVLGALQGATEFLPVSSSGHLILVPQLLGWPTPGLLFDVLVHCATACAVLLHFRADWSRMLAGAVRSARTGTIRDDPDARLLALLVLASIPAAVAGLVLEAPVERALSSDARSLAQYTAAFLLLTGTVLTYAEAIGSRDRLAHMLSPRGAIAVGLAQAVAVLPGISRSGATIAAGIGVGLGRTEAARFSFLLSAPIIAGAGLAQVDDLVAAVPSADEAAALALGFGAAFIVGYASIAWLLAYLRRSPLSVFALYTWAMGATALWLLR